MSTCVRVRAEDLSRRADFEAQHEFSSTGQPRQHDRRRSWRAGKGTGAARSGIALTNTSESAREVSLELTALYPASTRPAASLTIPASRQVARFIDEFFPELTPQFSGVLRIASTSTRPAQSAAGDLAVIGLRLTTNGRGDIVVTTTPPSDEDSTTTASDLFFPHLVDSAGWTTQFIVCGRTGGQTMSGWLVFTGQDGQPLELAVSPAAGRTIP